MVFNKIKLLAKIKVPRDFEFIFITVKINNALKNFYLFTKRIYYGYLF